LDGSSSPFWEVLEEEGGDGGGGGGGEGEKKVGELRWAETSSLF